MYKNIFKSCMILFIILFISGCGSSKINSKNISPNINTKNSFPYNINVLTSGGKEKSVLGIQEVSNINLFEAVTSTIKETKLFLDVKENSDLILELFIVRVGQPVAGKSMTVNVEIAWALKNKNEIIWKESIITSDTKRPADFTSAYNRVVEATIEATKKNIKEGLIKLSNLNIKL